MFAKRSKKAKAAIPEAPESPDTYFRPSKKRKVIQETKEPEDTQEINPNRNLSKDRNIDDPNLDGKTRMVQRLQISRKIQKGSIPEGIYRGLNSYPVYAEKTDSDINAYKITGSLGQVKASEDIKSSCRFDYAYGLCKDWREAGYCGYGDNCIFVHDRSEFKTSKQLEKEWEEQLNQKNTPQPQPKSTSVCGICQKEPSSPVLTRCHHLFCYHCALNNYSKSNKCYTCSKDTSGIFNEIKTSKRTSSLIN